MHKLSDNGTLIIPINPIAFGEIIVGHIRMTAKKEQHLTVFNYPIGRMIMDSCRTSPSLLHDIEELVNSLNWEFARTGKYYLIERSREVGELHTIVELVDVPVMDHFYKLVAKIVPQDNPTLTETLLREPVPHITLYTSDPEGMMGIGINSFFELVSAVKDTDPIGKRVSKILAYLLPRRVIEGIVIPVG